MAKRKSQESEAWTRKEEAIKDILRGIELKHVEIDSLLQQGRKLLDQSHSLEERKKLFQIISDKNRGLKGFCYQNIGWLSAVAADLSIRARERK